MRFYIKSRFVKLRLHCTRVRSGSTFLGELLSSPSDAVYFFEPLKVLDNEVHGLSKAVKARQYANFIRNLVNCKQVMG